MVSERGSLEKKIAEKMVPWKKKSHEKTSPKKRSLLKGMTGKFTVGIQTIFFILIDWSHSTILHTPKDTQRSPHDSTYDKLWETGVREPLRGELFPGFEFYIITENWTDKRDKPYFYNTNA